MGSDYYRKISTGGDAGKSCFISCKDNTLKCESTPLTGGYSEGLDAFLDYNCYL